MKHALSGILFAVISIIISIVGTVFLPGRYGMYMAIGLLSLVAFVLIFPKKKSKKISVGPYEWTENDFCRGWLITGQTGSGKTACAIKTIIHALFRDCPEWGGAVVDQKGQFYEVVNGIAEHYDEVDKLRILSVCKEPKLKYNLLSYPGIPWRTYAGIIVDTAESIGVKFSDSFWKNSAEELIEVMLQLVAVGKDFPSFGDLYDLINDQENMQSLLRDLTLMSNALNTSEKEMALKKLQQFDKLSKGQKDGVLGACKNMLNFFGDPMIRNVFCPDKNTVDFTDIDKGKIFIISMPQRYARERNYFNTFLKLLFSYHARFRFDEPASIRQKNLIAFIADEAQLVVTSSEHSSDHETVSFIREARATYILATQSVTSFAARLKKEVLDALVLNLANQMYFTVADEKAAKMASDVFGTEIVSEETKSSGRGGGSVSRRNVDKPIYKPAELRALKKFECIIKHPDGRHKKMYLPPVSDRGKTPYFYYEERYGFLAPLMFVFQSK